MTMSAPTPISLSLLAVIVATPMDLRGQQPDEPGGQVRLRELRDKKLDKPVFKKAPWRTDYDAALAEAKRSGKILFAYFTRSYAH